MMNTVSDFGLSRAKYTNAVIPKLGDEVLVFDFDSQSKSPPALSKGKIVSISSLFIVVKIGNKEWEILNGSYGKKI